MKHNLEDTQLYLPFWFVESYLSAFEQVPSEDDFVVSITDQHLYPRLDPKIGNFLSVIMPRFQHSLLEFQLPKKVKINLKDLKSDLASALRSTDAKQNLVLSLGGLRMNQMSGNSYKALPLFAGEEIHREDDGDFLHLLTNDISHSLLLGYRDLTDFDQPLLVEKNFTSFLREQPLVVWKSLWLELSGIERLLYLTLEKQMQWQCSLTHLDGSFHIGFDDLDWIIKKFHSTRKKGTRAFQAFSLLKKIGKKFVEQGLLAKRTDFEVMLMDSTESSGCPQLLWTSTYEKHQSLQESLYGRQVASHFIEGFLQENRQEAFCKTFGLSPLTISRDLRVFLLDQAKHLKIHPIAVKNFHDSKPHLSFLNSIILFVEYTLRFSEDSLRFPPSDGVRDIVGEVFTGNDFTFEQKYTRFQGLIERNFTFQEILSKEKGASVFTGELRSEFRQAYQKSSQNVIGKKEVEPARGAIEVEVNKSTGSHLKTDEIAAKPEGAFSRKDALALINDLSTKYTSTYRSLINQYLDSLDSQSKKLILDVQERMQPLSFNEHLRQRLVRYLVAKPEVRNEVEKQIISLQGTDD